VMVRDLGLSALGTSSTVHLMHLAATCIILATTSQSTQIHLVILHDGNPQITRDAIPLGPLYNILPACRTELSMRSASMVMKGKVLQGTTCNKELSDDIRYCCLGKESLFLVRSIRNTRILQHFVARMLSFLKQVVGIVTTAF
jgi:hypothetical protein